jgi:hypothetical protein
MKRADVLPNSCRALTVEANAPPNQTTGGNAQEAEGSVTCIRGEVFRTDIQRRPNEIGGRQALVSGRP